MTVSDQIVLWLVKAYKWHGPLLGIRYQHAYKVVKDAALTRAPLQRSKHLRVQQSHWRKTSTIS